MTATTPDQDTPEIQPGQHPSEAPPMTEPQPDSDPAREIPPSPTSPEMEPPEAYNSEQDDEPAQAQSVSGDAQHRPTAVPGSEDSEKHGAPNSGAINPEDVPDLIDHMEHMESSGHIDYGAFRGERSDDDEASTYGARENEDRDIKLSDE